MYCKHAYVSENLQAIFCKGLARAHTFIVNNTETQSSKLIALQILRTSLRGTFYTQVAKTILASNEVARVGWWMGMYGAASAKRQYALSNSPIIRRLDRGKLQVTFRKRVQTSVTYVDGSGKKRFHGTPQLKATEMLVLHTVQLL